MLRALFATVLIPCAGMAPAAPTNTVEVGDPTIAREGDWYYVFSSGVGAAIRRSKDLVNWELLPPVFPGAVPNWVREKIPTVTPIVWAPDILKFQNKYCCYYSYSTGVGSQRSVI
ncbi:MAG: arabinan endo-1,5-alpha-L-arabinosidase, partial [Betaproteobacteria bacterium]|nr:arabinan endo-1,5-alpha-L-arabinosidase [Betaproteobacteria bacterium]